MTFAVQESHAQSEPGHVYTVRSHTVHPGKEGEYNAFYRDVVRPVFDHMKANGDIVAYLDLVEVIGDRKGTHLLIIEYANYAAMDDAPAKLEAASQAVLNKSFGEAVADLPEIRDWIKTELFMSPQNN